MIIKKICLWVICCCSLSISFEQSVFNIKDFGAKGDGKSDDYNAFRLLADSVNKLGSAEIIFPKGNYFIAVYHTPNNKFKDIVFKNCNGIKIIGTHAIITINGNFIRGADRFNGHHHYSYTNAIIPLGFSNCKNIIIHNIEINGGVKDMTKDNDVVENGTHLINLFNCQNIEIDNVYLHHAQSDGLYIRGDSSYNLTIKNSTFANNGRQGMSIVGLVKGYFVNCIFKNTGITEGKYGNHKPSDGVDIEPDRNVRDIYFDSCTFSNNLGGQFICTAATTSHNIRLNHCNIEAGISHRQSQVICYADTLLIENSFIDCGTGALYGTWSNKRKAMSSNVEISNSTIKSSYYGLISIGQKGSHSKLNILNDTLIYTADTVNRLFPMINMPILNFVNNVVIYKSHAVSNINAGYCGTVTGKGLFLNNEFISQYHQFIPLVNNIGMTTTIGTAVKEEYFFY